ncbi:MAG: AAA family ATPase [Actinomycetota bacterium]|nr:AAA family ATPase [Actinomycetota bacterium]
MSSVGVSLPEGQRRESGSTPKHNLPAQRTAFVGREPEILEVKRQLAMTRLLTLTGAAASGRTRLALEVAQDLVGAYPGGVWLVELAPLSEEALVLPAVAKAVKVPEQPGRPLTDALVDALREKRLLLILDNCEHLKEERVQLADVTCCRWWVWASGKPPARALRGTPSRASRRRRTLSLPHQARTGFSVRT